MEKKICCICGKEFTGWGYNPNPVKDKNGGEYPEGSVCCKDCDSKYVIPLKLDLFFEQLKAEGD